MVAEWLTCSPHGAPKVLKFVISIFNPTLSAGTYPVDVFYISSVKGHT